MSLFFKRALAAVVLVLGLKIDPLRTLIFLGCTFLLGCSYIVYGFVSRRQAAFPEAKQLLQDQIQAGKAVRTRHYDLYLPSFNREGAADCNTNRGQALLFLPGGLVEHAAYAHLAVRLAQDHGILVIVVNLEPTRIATWYTTGLTSKKLVELAKRAESWWKTSSLQWNIGGHSAGNILGVEYFPELATKYHWNKNICLGAGIPDDPTGILNKDNTIIVQASNDGYLSFYGDEKQREFQEKFTVVRIQGGNHAGVAHYGPQIFPMKDGEREIDLMKQQELTAKAIADFLLKKGK